MASWMATHTATTIACARRAVRYPQRLRGVAITDLRIKPETLREWHRLGMRGLRFHFFAEKTKLTSAASASTC